ncbi:hypothetical protein [Chamaesiphon polymorphus]|uniref:P pilus assembly protein, chaperone PapD n=1 Tax=Chamaesiphon polymorphus CCALA 037 TaxID=2107692 RepID=A0A2T1GGY2_9CYAN|nr:hypothetical protein [Chamaesiphon polymorphus]PSB56918.1 hypothetical protein C7B77_10240 [Chamaesiphon polymorphus CCALA 037]
MTNKITNLLTTLVGMGIVGTSLVALVSTVRAQEISITVSPVVTLSQLQGSQSRSTFSVTNRGTIPIRTRIYAQDFDYDKDKGYVKIANHPNSASPFLQFSPKELTIAPGVTRDVRLNITIPPSQPDGEYRVAIFTEDLTERKITDPNQKFVTIIRPQIASLFFVTKGNVTPQLSAVSVGWNNQNKSPRLVLKNQGQASAYPTINWQIEQGGKSIVNSEVRGVIVQTGKERAIDLKLDEKTKLAPGQYKLVGKINGGGKEVPFALDLNIPAK